MSQTRRAFLQSSAAFGFLGSVPLLRGTPGGAVGSMEPGLLFGPEDLPRIRATLARPEFAAYWKGAHEADLAADERFLEQEFSPISGTPDLARADGILLRSSFVHAVDPHSGHLRVARQALARVLGYRRWDWVLDAGNQTVGVMRGPSTCVSVILASDWLGEALSAAEHGAIARRLGETDGPACSRAVFGETHHDQVAWKWDPEATGMTAIDVSRWPWILDRTNLRITATAGLAAVACFLQGRHPDADRWCEQSVASLKLFASRLPPDGSFPEYVGYWAYTFSFYSLALEMLRRARGIDGRGWADFPAMARFALTSAAPTLGRAVDCINVGDCATSAGAVPLAWIGRNFRDGTSQYLIARPETVRADEATSALAAIWFDADVPARRAEDAPLDRTCAPGLVLSRSGWNIDDGVVCLRSGGPSNHEHADRNSVIFLAHGERLLHDPLHASYWRADPKWKLRLTPAHTAVLLDGRGHAYFDDNAGTHSSLAQAILLDHQVDPSWMTATSDAAQAYQLAALPALRVVRTVVYVKPDILVFFDRISLTEPLPAQLRFQVYNDDSGGSVRASRDGFEVSRPHASLRARFVSRGPAAATTGQLDLPAPGGVYPFAEIACAEAKEHAILTVCTGAPKGEAHGALALAAESGAWTVRGSHRRRRVSLRIEERDNGVPAVTCALS